MIKVLSTTDYSKFKLMEGNRPVSKRINGLMREIKRKNMLAQFPILCQQNRDGRMYVADGQHRLEAARALKLPVFYTIAKDVTIEDIAHANSAQKAWNINDYLASWIARGNKHYATLRRFIEQYEVPVTVALQLLGSGPGGSQLNAFRNGTFTAQGIGFAEKVGAFLQLLKPIVPFYTDRGFVLALARVMRLKEFDPQRFLQKLEYQSTKLVKCANWEQYVALIEEIYNFKVRPSQLVPLAMDIKRAK
jgi:hypothetical protein